MADVHREVELKYAADEAFQVPPLTELVGGGEDGRPWNGIPLSEGDTAQQKLDAYYFDTADFRLAAAGLTLRRRTGGDDAGWHLKVPAGIATRSEIRLPPGRVPPGRAPRAVPTELLSMVWAQTFGAPLQPIARITTERSVRRLADPTGQILLEVADDRVTGRRLLPSEGAGDAAGAPTSWREIEVELSENADGLGDVVDKRLRKRGLSPAPTASKLAYVLGQGGKEEPASDDTTKLTTKLTTKSRASDVLMAHIATQVAQVQAQDLPVRLDAQDAVHKMRVATRRLRSALTTFKALFDPDVVRPLRGELKWLAGELGAARDAEVMRDRVRAAVEGETHDPALLAGADVAHSELAAAYRAAHDRVLSELDGERYHQILTALHALVEAPPLRKPAKKAAGKALPPLVERSYVQVRSFVDEARSMDAGAEREELFHDARKAAKIARYAGESVAPVFGKDAMTFAAAMEAVQEALGEYQDSVLTRERLRDLALHASSLEVAFLYGRLHALEEQNSSLSHEHFDAAWKSAGRKSVHRWLR